MNRTVVFVLFSSIWFAFNAGAVEDFNQPFTPDANTRALYHFDETSGSTAVADASANSNDGTTLTGFAAELDPNTTWVTSLPGFGNCASTSQGSNAGVIQVDQYSGHSTLGFASGANMTIEFWIYPLDTGAPSGRRIVQKNTGDDYAVTYSSTSQFIPGKLGFLWYAGGGWQFVEDDTPIDRFSWTHVAILVDRASDPGKDRIYFVLNGVLSSIQENTNKGGLLNTGDAWILGSHDGNTTYQFYGKIDELRISDCLRDYPGGYKPIQVGVLFPEAVSSIKENEGAAQIKVRLSAVPGQAVTVPFTISGSAVAGSDYTAPAYSELSFNSDEIEQTIEVPIINDGTPERAETVKITLGTPVGARLSRVNEHRLVIVDDDTAAPASAWIDRFYSFRKPITVTVPAPGEYALGITADMITNWMNVDSTFQFKSYYFNLNGIKLVEIDAGGNVIDADVDARFQYRFGNEMVTNGNFESGLSGWSGSTGSFPVKSGSYDGSSCVTTEGADMLSIYQSFTPPANSWYKFSCYKLADASIDVVVDYNWLGLSYQPILHTFADPYVSATKWVEKEYFFFTGDKSDWTSPTMVVRMIHFTGAADNVSLKPCDVKFVLNASSAGTKRYMLYYAPLEGTTVQLPGAERTAALPGQTLAVTSAGSHEWFNDNVQYTLHTDSNADVWYSASTRKVRPNDPAPVNTRSAVSISAARNESEALQLVYAPKTSGQISAVTMQLTGPSNVTLTNADADIRLAQYVDIDTASKTGLHYKQASRMEFTGRLPDPLVAFAPVSYIAGGQNILLWVDVTVPDTAPAGVYAGDVALTTSAGSITIPVELTVYDFTLPDVPSCRSALQAAMYAHVYLFPYHKVDTTQDKYDLTRKYTTEMTRYRVSPFSATTAYWHYPYTPPVSNFPEYDTQLPWAIDQAQVSAYNLLKYSGPAFRNYTEYDMDQMAADQVDRIAYLAANNWLDIGFCGFDEPQPVDYPQARYLVDKFREGPGGDQIKWFVYSYHGNIWDGMYDHANIITAIDNDFRSSLSYTGASLMKPGDEAWIYWTNTSHTWIDAPGLTNRLRAPKFQKFGASGMAVWNILQWWDLPGYADTCDNPWINPYTPWGNGTNAYFYPPSPLGEQLPQKDMSVVPSLRMVLMRDGIEDYEYVQILKDLIEQAEAQGKDSASAVAALEKAQRPFISPDSWVLSDGYWFETRALVAGEIENLRNAVSAVFIVAFDVDISADTATIAWNYSPGATYQLYYTDEPGLNTAWTPVSMNYTVDQGTATQTFDIDPFATKRFFKLKML